MKELIFKKVIIDLKPDGSFKDGTILYQEKVDGVIESRKRHKSLKINNMPFNKPQFAKIVKTVKAQTELIEKIDVKKNKAEIEARKKENNLGNMLKQKEKE